MGTLLLQMSNEFQKATIKEPLITQWNYFTEFQVELIKSQLHMVRTMHLLDPWSKHWQDMEIEIIKILNELTNQEVKNGQDPRGNH